MQEKISEIKVKFLKEIEDAGSLKKIDEIFLELFGKNGVITELPKHFKGVSKEELKEVGPLFNKTKQELEEKIRVKRQEVKEESYKEIEKESFDINAKVELPKRSGHLHPLTQFEQQIVELFRSIGFQQFESPEIDDEYNNFEALNIPEGHPARDMWDTLYIEGKGERKEGNLLLRTHTTNFQNRAMKKFKPPIRLVNIGRCFRYENLDARHEHTFDQFDLIYIDKEVSMANLQYLSEYLLKQVFGPEIKVRMRPKYYPFVEPGAGVDGLCLFCKGKGCKVCGGIGWLELAGAGMVHPFVLKMAGLDPYKYSGLAWGFGPARMAMLQNQIEDIRLLMSGDLKFLQKF